MFVRYLSDRLMIRMAGMFKVNRSVWTQFRLERVKDLAEINQVRGGPWQRWPCRQRRKYACTKMNVLPRQQRLTGTRVCLLAFFVFQWDSSYQITVATTTLSTTTRICLQRNDWTTTVPQRQEYTWCLSSRRPDQNISAEKTNVLPRKLQAYRQRRECTCFFTFSTRFFVPGYRGKDDRANSDGKKKKTEATLTDTDKNIPAFVFKATRINQWKKENTRPFVPN